jgi:hypothetical protein
MKKLSDNSCRPVNMEPKYSFHMEQLPMSQSLLCQDVMAYTVQSHCSTNNLKAKKTLGFQVDKILYQRLADAAWRKRITLSKLLRQYCEDSLHKEIILEGEGLKA